MACWPPAALLGYTAWPRCLAAATAWLESLTFHCLFAFHCLFTAVSRFVTGMQVPEHDMVPRAAPMAADTAVQPIHCHSKAPVPEVDCHFLTRTTCELFRCTI